jgi:hypothetical protein
MNHVFEKSNITIVVRNPQGVVVKNETFSLNRLHEREPMITERMSRGARPANASLPRRPVQRMFFAWAK